MNTEWKPIASAPKDGSSILGWGPQQDRVVIAWNEWARPEPGWEAVGLEVNGFECPKIVLRGEPTLWQSLPVEPCMTCGGHGMIGGLTPHSGYDAEPCPDCSPAPTSHPIPTGATGEDEPVAKVRRGHYGGRVGNIGFQRVVLLPGVRVMDNTLLYARPAPAAGDALDKARLDWLEQHDGRFYNKDRISSIVGVGFLVAGDLTGMRHQSVRAAIDAAIVQQSKRKEA